MWFKQVYVRDIVLGIKADTLRPAGRKPPEIGSLVRFAVGPRSPFAEARIVDWMILDAADVPADRNGRAASIMKPSTSWLYIEFEVVRVYRECPEVWKVLTPPEVDVRFDQEGGVLHA